MRNLLLGVGIAWLSFSKEGQALTARIVEQLKEQYLLPKENAPAEKKKEDTTNV